MIPATFFSEQIAQGTAEPPARQDQGSSLEEVRGVLRKAELGQPLENSELLVLLAAGSDPILVEEIEISANRIKNALCGRRIGIVIPQYLTSFCQNECLYCAYRVGNRLVPRKRLELPEFEEEFRQILRWGYRQVELVLADDPGFPADRLAEYVQRARRWMNEVGGGILGLNGPAYHSAQYRLLAEAGVDWVGLWQETYQESQFLKWHVVPSPKAHYRFRLDALDRALLAGIPQVAPGILFGLSDWRLDVLRLIQQCRHLASKYGKSPYALGIPRLKPALGSPAGGKRSKFTVNDLQYRLALAVLKLAVPRSRLFFNTREPLSLNWQMLCGGNLFTIDCSTYPGGYLDPVGAGQFATESYGEREALWGALRSAEFQIENFVCEEPGASQQLAGPPSSANGQE